MKRNNLDIKEPYNHQETIGKITPFQERGDRRFKLSCVATYTAYTRLGPKLCGRGSRYPQEAGIP